MWCLKAALLTVGRNGFRNQSSDADFANLFTLLYLNIYYKKIELMEASHLLRRRESEQEAALEVTCHTGKAHIQGTPHSSCLSLSTSRDDQCLDGLRELFEPSPGALHSSHPS